MQVFNTPYSVALTKILGCGHMRVNVGEPSAYRATLSKSRPHKPKLDGQYDVGNSCGAVALVASVTSQGSLVGEPAVVATASLPIAPLRVTPYLEHQPLITYFIVRFHYRTDPIHEFKPCFTRQRLRLTSNCSLS